MALRMLSPAGAHERRSSVSPQNLNWGSSILMARSRSSNIANSATLTGTSSSSPPSRSRRYPPITTSSESPARASVRSL